MTTDQPTKPPRRRAPRATKAGTQRVAASPRARSTPAPAPPPDLVHVNPPVTASPVPASPVPTPRRVEAPLTRRTALLAGLGVFAGGGLLGLGVAAALRQPGPRVAATAPIWFIEEEPLPADIHVSVAPAVRPAPPRPTQPVQAAPSPAPRPSVAASTPVEPPPSPKQPPSPMAQIRPPSPPHQPIAPGRPMIAIVIDDVGVDRARSERVIALPSPVTIAFMTYAEQPRHWMARARGEGHEYLVHVPMQPAGAGVNAGPHVLTVGQDRETLLGRLRWGLDRWDGEVGVNNHMGSRFTEDAAGMALVAAELKRRELLFLDSRTSPRSVGAVEAARASVPWAERNVFLDNEPTVAGVRRQLAVVEDLARKRGYAIAIGHPHEATTAVLGDWIPAIEARGMTVASLTTVMRYAGRIA